MSFLDRVYPRSSSSPKTGGDVPPKRISTPAGQRLSVILENGANQFQSRPRRASLSAKLGNGVGGAAAAGANGGSIEAQDDRWTSGQSSSWSDSSPVNEKAAAKKLGSRRGGWKRLAIIVVLIVFLVVAIVVGVVVGTRRSKGGARFVVISFLSFFSPF